MSSTTPTCNFHTLDAPDKFTGQIVCRLFGENKYTLLWNYDPSIKTILVLDRSIENVLMSGQRQEFVLDHIYQGIYYYLNKTCANSPLRPPHVCSDGIVHRVTVVMTVNNNGVVLVKEKFYPNLLLPSGYATDLTDDNALMISAAKEITKKTGYSQDLAVIEKIADYQSETSFIDVSHKLINSVFKLELNQDALDSILKFNSLEIEEVVFVTKEHIVQRKTDKYLISPNHCSMLIKLLL